MILNIICCVHKNYIGVVNVYNNFLEIKSPNVRLIVKDSGYCDKTRIFFEKKNDSRLIFSCEPDTGIYNAINYSIHNFCDVNDCYLVVGSDDTFYSKSIDLILENKLLNNKEIYTFAVEIGGKVHFPKNKNKLYVSLYPNVVSHSVGTIIPVSLHKNFGMYDESYKILSDSKFLTQVILSETVKINSNKIIIGTFSLNGISNKNISLRIIEAYRYHIELGYSNYIQIILYFFRKFKYFLKDLWII